MSDSNFLRQGLDRIAEELAKKLEKAIGRKTQAYKELAIKHLDSKRLIMKEAHSYVPQEDLDKEFMELVRQLKEIKG